ncbi:hypothetical protein Y032_0121g1006 [Ancylostoma ceylanicum]|uniref:Uncharacterized protein n=1 Tax=Ancylostoma ceylanicum TaxID=53326 RepID=A0A016T9F0_9BILA|nr:hypothetical protein Y032_0121g1006 [Ancylostoma ceylanicum]
MLTSQKRGEYVKIALAPASPPEPTKTLPIIARAMRNCGVLAAPAAVDEGEHRQELKLRMRELSAPRKFLCMQKNGFLAAPSPQSCRYGGVFL